MKNRNMREWYAGEPTEEDMAEGRTVVMDDGWQMEWAYAPRARTADRLLDEYLKLGEEFPGSAYTITAELRDRRGEVIDSAECIIPARGDGFVREPEGCE